MPLLTRMNDQRRFAVIILAAGQGTRMRSDTHKVLHPIASRPLLLHLLYAEGGPPVVVLSARPPDPLKYGRIILGEGDRIARMVEYKDATEEERAVRLCNSGMMAVRSADLFRWLGKVGNDNAAGEY